MKRSVFTVVPVLALLAGASALPSMSAFALARESAVLAAGPVNKNCPIMGKEVDAETPTREFKGVTIGFCCPGCDRKWDKKTDAEKMTLLAKASPEAITAILAADDASKRAAQPAAATTADALASNPAVKVARTYLDACGKADTKALDAIFLDKGRATVSENASDEGSWETYRDHHLMPELKEMPGFALSITNEDVQTFGATSIVRQIGSFTVPDPANKDLTKKYLAAVTYVVVDDEGTPRIAHLHWSSRAEKKLDAFAPAKSPDAGHGHDHK